MLSENKNQIESKKDPNDPENFMLYTSTVITEALAEYAAVNLNETEESRKKGLKEIREILRKDEGLIFTDEDNFLLCFLRSRKMDPKRAADLLKRGYEFVESHRSILERVDSHVVRNVIRANMVGFLPYRDRQGRAMIYARADAWDPDQIPADDAIFGGIVAIRSAMDNPVNQVAGFIVILDLNNLKLQQVLAMTSWLIFGTQALQRCCPCLLKEFHVINTPSIYKIGWKLVKPLLSEKIRKRFIFHKSSNWESLHKIVPPTVLPEELGGQLGPFTNDHWAQDISAIEKQYYEKLQYGYISKRKKVAS